MTFSFVQTDATGNAAAPQTAVRGAGSTTFVTADFAAPAIPVFANSAATVNSSPVRLVGTAEVDSTVELFKGGTSVTTVTATGGTFEFTGVTLTGGRNGFTLTATDAALNISAKSGALVITLDTKASAAPTPTETDLTITSVTSNGLTQQLSSDRDENTVVNVDNANVIISGTGPAGLILSGTNDAIPHCIGDSRSLNTIIIAADGTWSLSFTIDDDTTQCVFIFGMSLLDDNLQTKIRLLVTPPTETPTETKKKKSGGSDDWHKKPTFGISHLTYKQIVDNGFTFNDYSLTVTDNWHTDFHLTSSLIGETNTVKIKTYAADPLKWINLYLGVPRLGDVSEAESEIHLVVSRNYTNPVDYDLDEINHYQKEGLVNENNTSASISKVKCQASDNDEKCYEFTINFTVMAPLHEEVIAISAMDDKRRQHVTYINEGVEFTGTPLLDAHTAQLMQKKTNQGQVEIIELTQQNRRYNVWEDQHGYLWTLNEYGTWTQITAADFERHQDSTSSVMTRQNSNFASLIEQERQKALLVFDSGGLISELDDYFAYDYSNVTSDMSKLEKYAYELQLESERAQKYSSNSD